MAADPRVLELFEEMHDAGKTPEEVCRGCPKLLAKVQERWREFHRIDVAPAADLPQIPGYKLSGEIGRGGM
jgi:serine/threonine-protein kinase